MKIKKKIFIGVVVFASTLYAYEPSVYGAGDINSATPYGLTSTEQSILDNKKTIQRLFNKLTEMQRKIDGLTSVIEGLNKDNLELKERLALKDRLDAQERQGRANESNQTRQFLLELSKKVDELANQSLSQPQNNPQEYTNTPIGSNMDSGYSNNSETIDETYMKAVQLFGQRSYEAAKEYFEKTLAGGYKAAPSNYYLGEIAYYTHDYVNAVAYYKESAALYDKASYMDVLFLHTAISLDQTGESKQAKAFYQYVIDNYPNKKSAAIARSRM